MSGMFDPFGDEVLVSSCRHNSNNNSSFSSSSGGSWDPLPASLQGGASAVSSRRPSFAAEVSVRQSASRVDFGQPLSASNSYPLFSNGSGSGPAVDTSRWPHRVSSLWTQQRGPIYSPQDSPSPPPPHPHPPRHLHQSFSHSDARSPFSRALFNSSMPYNENSISDAINNIKLDSPSSRRHSLATCIAEKNIHPFSDILVDSTQSLLAQVDSYFNHAPDRCPLPSYQLMCCSPTRQAFLTKLDSIPSLNIISSYSASLPYPSNQILYCVEFKAGRLDIFYLCRGSGLVVKSGDLVIVDADRGKDLGRVVCENLTPDMARKFKVLQHQEQQAILQQSSGTSAKTEINLATILQPKQILRFAQSSEIQQVISKKNDEEKAKSLCLSRVQERNMSMQVCDAEYQWDRRKLTFFYTAQHRIDFRDLVRDLFRIYKTRIWMCAVDIVPIDINSLPPLILSNNNNNNNNNAAAATPQSPIGSPPIRILSSSLYPASPMMMDPSSYFNHHHHSSSSSSSPRHGPNGFTDTIYAPSKVWC